MATMQQQLREISAEIDEVNTEQPPETKVNESLPPLDEIQGAVEDVEDVGVEAPVEELEVHPSEEIQNIEALAKQIEVEPSFIYELEVGMGNNQPAVKLGDLKDKYQQVLSEKSQWLQEKEALALQVQQTQQNHNLGQQMSQDMVNALGNIKAIQQQNEATNWQQLETDDPGQAALYKQKLNEAYQTAQTQYSQAENKQQQMVFQQREQLSVQAKQKLLQDIPEWNDNNVATAEKADISNTARSFGFTDEDLNGISDPRVVMLLRRLMLLERQAKDSSAAVKRVQKAPKVLKGHGRQAPKADNVDQLIKEAREAPTSNRRRKELDAARAILSGG